MSFRYLQTPFDTLIAFLCVIIAFVAHPHSLNISEGETANFSCIGTHTSSFGMFWKINGIGLHDHGHRRIIQHQKEVLSEEATRSILTVPGISINDNINVECVLSPLTPKSLYSGLAFLRIQGIEYTNSKLANFYSILSFINNKQEHWELWRMYSWCRSMVQHFSSATHLHSPSLVSL